MTASLELTNREIAKMIGVRICCTTVRGGFMVHPVKADCGTVMAYVKPSRLRAWLIAHVEALES